MTPLHPRKSVGLAGAWPLRVAAAALVLAFVAAGPASAVHAPPLYPRSLGLDVSAHQGNIDEGTWSAIHTDEFRDFVFIRSSRGGTTGVDQRQGGFPPGSNTFFNLSQRYDDPYFVQNITRATAVGMFAGPYHFGRMDVVASTQNSGGIPNNGTDEANHFIQMAGPWMRPGYLVPVFDLESGEGIRTPEQLAQFAIDFSNRINEVMNIRPAVYIGNNYSSPMESIPSAAALVEAYPTLWIARWPNQAEPDTIPVQTADPGDFTSTVYGPWDNPPNPADPWHFWQYASTGRLQSYNDGMSNLDFDVAKGGLEFLKDRLVPAVWVSNTSGDWSTLSNWNSGRTPTQPPHAPGQLIPYATGPLPTPRLPGVDDTTNNIDGQNDTVVLDSPADVTVTLSTGTHDIRKLYVREKLNITGGSLIVNYTPSPDSTPIAAQFSEAVTLSGDASLQIHTLQVDAQQTFTLEGGTLSFHTINLMPHPSNPATIKIMDEVTWDTKAFTFGNTTIERGEGSGKSGFVDLGGGNRIVNIERVDSAEVTVHVPILNGGLTKAGPGTLVLNGANSLLDDTTVQTGTLSVNRRLFSNAAELSVATGAELNLTFTGSPDIVRSLVLGGTPSAPGTWGSVGSVGQGLADFESALITGNGRLHVDPTAPEENNVGNVIDDFEIEGDEGHFRWPYNNASVAHTFGLSAATTIEQVTAEHQGVGEGSQLLNLVASGPNWQLKHNSGDAAGGAADPAGNEPLDGIGHVGFWLKTDDPGITVRIGIDDPVTGFPLALERGVAMDVVADNQWHLYQWDFEDSSHWQAYQGGANGIIDAEMGTVTIDSIWFAGIGNAQIYLDTVSHNPDGPLAPPPMPGDYNGDGLITAADYDAWRASFGQSSGPADGNGDGIVDAADYVIWRKAASMSGGGAASLAAVPEPSGFFLLAAVGIFLFALRCYR